MKDAWLVRLNRFLLVADQNVTVVLPPHLSFSRRRAIFGPTSVMLQVLVGQDNGASCEHTPWLVVIDPHRIDPKVLGELLMIPTNTKDGRTLPLVIDFT